MNFSSSFPSDEQLYDIVDRRCDFNSHFNNYQILKFDTFNPSQLIDGLVAILRKHQVPEESIDYIKTSISTARTAHRTMGTAEQEQTKEAILSSKYLMDLLIKMRCDFNSHFNNYQILKFDSFNPSQLIDGLAAILRKHHVPEESVDYIKTSISTARTAHRTMGTAEQQQTKEAILSSKYLMDLLIKMYFYDYVLLGFPIPLFNLSN
ncbi:hypothetical protein ANCDUO_15219 [Ancylostoma duodenale]|uniref:Uncharacterized protein n=1 Tax=Ancylostoma duodenale TaxID=51022 RepID=A0A0C2G6U0_9BILA|nr:hypothetical protein ANCDUO_15219 [Ancylostoma duodenale]